MQKVHDPEESSKRERFYNEVLDNYFSTWFYVKEADRQEDGIDRLFIHKVTQEKHFIEYKNDEVSASSGNAFIETKSSAYKKGWIYTLKADILLIYSPPIGRIYCINVPDIKSKVEEWSRMFLSRSVPNKKNGISWYTEGILVPLEYIAETSFRTIEKTELQCTYNNLSLLPALF